VRTISVVAALAAAIISGICSAQELTPAQAEELLQAKMPAECGIYYTSQGEPEFAALADKVICKYRPKVTRIAMTANGGAATADYTRDREFDSELTTIWLDAYARMAPRKPDSLLFKKLKSNLESYRANGGFDRGYKPSKASFKLSADGWKVVSID
jgi:hypothetical protein